jgi:hypothetical protein
VISKIAFTAALTFAAGTALAQADPCNASGQRLSEVGERPMAMLGSHHGLGDEASAKAAIEAKGYREVKNLSRDSVGNWAAEAERGGVEIAVVLQVNGEISEE